VLCEVRIISKQEPVKKQKITSSVILTVQAYKNITVYLGKDRELSLPLTTVTDATVTTLTIKTKNVGNKLYMYNTSPDLFDVLRQ
jgi:hypothetical protein